MTNARDTEGGFEEITRNYPFVEHIYRLKKGLSASRGSEEAEWGLTVKKYWADVWKYSFCQGWSISVPSRLFLRSESCSGTTGAIHRVIVENALQYMEGHHYLCVVISWSIYIAHGQRRSQECPLHGALDTDCREDSAIAFSEDRKRTELKKIFGCEKLSFGEYSGIPAYSPILLIITH